MTHISTHRNLPVKLLKLILQIGNIKVIGILINYNKYYYYYFKFINHMALLLLSCYI